VREYIKHFPGFSRIDTGKPIKLVAEESRSNEIQAHCKQTGHPYSPYGRIFKSDHSANALEVTNSVQADSNHSSNQVRGRITVGNLITLLNPLPDSMCATTNTSCRTVRRQDSHSKETKWRQLFTPLASILFMRPRC
jgi:hypothetical protein